MMKFELGMFNYEQSNTCKALQLQPELSQLAQMKSEQLNYHAQKNSFPLAMMFAKLDQSLSPSELLTLQPKVLRQSTR